MGRDGKEPLQLLGSFRYAALVFRDCLLTEPVPSDPSTFSKSTSSKHILSSSSDAQLNRGYSTAMV